MVDNGMQKSCLTLILVVPDRSQTNNKNQTHSLTDDCPINDALEDMLPCRAVISESGASTSNTESIPIKYTTDGSHSGSVPGNDIVMNSKAKYRCTLEVKFVRYVGIE